MCIKRGTMDITSFIQRWKPLRDIKALVNSGQVLLVNIVRMEDDSQRCHKTVGKEPGVSY